jgi:signal transduction histidine kinase
MAFDEAARLQALNDYEAISTPTGTFDEIALVAARLSGVPIALVTLLDATRQLFKGRVGFSLDSAPREHAFCEQTIRLGQPLVVSDLSTDERFRANPLVRGEAGLRFYCGVPVRTPDGQALGTLCVLDNRARELDPETLVLLQALARQVETELEVRRRLSMLEAQRETNDSKQLLAAMVAHDLRSPLTTILVAAEVLRPADAESRTDLELILDSAERMRRMLRDFLDVTLFDSGHLKLRLSTFPFAPLLTSAVSRLTRSASRRGQRLSTSSSAAPTVRADAELIERVVTNLVSNALHHAPANQPVTVALGLGPTGGARVEVRDLGEPLAEPDRARLFEPLVQGPTVSRHGYGLGLAFCRLAIEAHGGVIGVQPGQPTGNTFFFELPP